MIPHQHELDHAPACQKVRSVSDRQNRFAFRSRQKALFPCVLPRSLQTESNRLPRPPGYPDPAPPRAARRSPPPPPASPPRARTDRVRLRKPASDRDRSLRPTYKFPEVVEIRSLDVIARCLLRLSRLRSQHQRHRREGHAARDLARCLAAAHARLFPAPPSPAAAPVFSPCVHVARAALLRQASFSIEVAPTDWLGSKARLRRRPWVPIRLQFHEGSLRIFGNRQIKACIYPVARARDSNEPAKCAEACSPALGRPDEPPGGFEMRSE